MSFTMTEDQSADAAVPISPAQIIEIAREVTRQPAPDELPVFDDVADAWSSTRNERDERARRDPKAGLGFEAVLLCELLFPIITGAIGQVLGTEAMEQIPAQAPRPAFGRRAV